MAHAQQVPVALVVVHALVAHLAQVAQALAAQAAHPVPVVSTAQVAHPVPVAAQVSLAQPVAAVAQLAAVVAAPAVAPLVLSARVAVVARARLASQSVRNAKSSNKEVCRALVAQLCLVAMAPPVFVCVAVQAFKTLPTRLRQMLVS